MALSFLFFSQKMLLGLAWPPDLILLGLAGQIGLSNNIRYALTARSKNIRPGCPIRSKKIESGFALLPNTNQQH